MTTNISRCPSGVHDSEPPRLPRPDRGAGAGLRGNSFANGPVSHLRDEQQRVLYATQVSIWEYLEGKLPA